MTDDVIDVEAEELPPEGEEGVNLPVVREESTALVARGEINVSELIQQSSVIEEAMRLAMKEDVHYGKIPGVNKPTLLKPGAEKLLVLFRLSPEYDSEKIWHDDGHLTVMVKCSLRHIPTGLKIAEGEGLCTTKESRYAWRKGGRVCPECGKDTIIKGKKEYGGGWLCFAKKGGCGAKWDDSDPQAAEFENAVLDRAPNPDLPDSYNTVLKMGDKRALLAAILNGTAASDVFTQDMEDAPRGDGGDSRIRESETVEEEAFNPSTMLRPDAPKKKEGWAGISRMLNELDPSLEWGAIIRQAISGVYGGDGDFRKLPDLERSQAAYRAANAAGRLTELFINETFLSIESIQRAFAEMFDGIVIDVPEFHPSEETATTLESALEEIRANEKGEDE